MILPKCRETCEHFNKILQRQDNELECAAYCVYYKLNNLWRNYAKDITIIYSDSDSDLEYKKNIEKGKEIFKE